MQHARISPNSAAAQIHHAEHKNAIAGHTQARLRTARSVITHQRDLIAEKAAKLTPDPEVRKVTATAIRCLLAPYTTDDGHSTRRVLLSAAAITTVLAAVAVLRNR